MSGSGPARLGWSPASSGAQTDDQTDDRPTVRVRRKSRAAMAHLADSGLPEPVQRRILRLIDHARLGAEERREIARELTAHALDAIDAGVAPDDLLAELNDPGPIAALYTRAAKRKRPLLYQIRRRVTQATLAALGLMTIVYALLAVRYYAGVPKVKVDYLAQLNARVLEAPPRDKAWPVYEEAIVAWYRVEAELLASTARDFNSPDPLLSYAGVEAIPALPDEHPDRPETVRAMVDFRPVIDRVIEATRRPMLGMVLSHDTRLIPVEGTDRKVTVNLPPRDHARDQAPILQASTPHLRYALVLARLLAFEAIVAGERDESDRVVAAISAMLRLSDQAHAEPFLHGGKINLSIYNYAHTILHIVIEDNPSVLAPEHCERLWAQIRAAKAPSGSFDIGSEQIVFLDILQRTFTDDGRGSGRLTPAGVRLINTLADTPLQFGLAPGDDDSWIRRSGLTATAPLAGATVADRDRQFYFFTVLLDQVRAALDKGPSGITDMALWIDAQFKPLENASRPRWTPLIELTPSYFDLLNETYRARIFTDVTRTLFAAIEYRHDHGDWPHSLDQLLHSYLDHPPADPFDPAHPMGYRVQAGLPFIWVRGPDLDDDRGHAPPDFPHRRLNQFIRSRYSPETEDVPDTDIFLFPSEVLVY